MWTLQSSTKNYLKTIHACLFLSGFIHLPHVFCMCLFGCLCAWNTPKIQKLTSYPMSYFCFPLLFLSLFSCLFYTYTASCTKYQYEFYKYVFYLLQVWGKWNLFLTMLWFYFSLMPLTSEEWFSSGPLDYEER